MDRSIATNPDTHELSILQLRDNLNSLEAKIKACPETIKHLDVMHHFTNGIYARTALMKAGDLIVGKIHKKEHLVVVSAGKAKVVSEEFGSKDIVAPQIFKSPPGVKRALFIIEDMVWTTVHENPSNTEDLSVLEAELIAKDYDEVKS